GSHSRATRVSLGTTSLSSSSRLPARSGELLVNPVTLPPGRARLSTNPVPTGSPAAAMTIGVAVVTFLAGRVSVAPLVTMISTSRWTNSAARSGRRLFLPSAYRYSMTMFCPSIHPRSRSPCWNALCQGAVSEAENGERMPIRAIFFGCWASAFTTRATNTTATRIDDSAAFFITHLVSSVIYHAHGNKGMCDLHGGRRHGFVERKDPILLERQLDGTQDLFDGEYSS